MRYHLLLIAFLSMPSTVVAVTDNNLAWQNYLQQDSHLAPSLSFPHNRCFKAASIAYDLPETLLLAVARGESDFEATARSKANAHGVMQIQWPGTAKHLGIYRLSDLYDPCTNIDAGARYVKELITRYDDNLHLALAAYNYGPGRIDPADLAIPEGAEWYSGYIFRHLGYVLGDRNSAQQPSLSKYSELGRTTLLSFGEPYRAAAFVEGLERTAPSLQLDWFRRGVGKFDVVVMYNGEKEYQASAGHLTRAGFPLD